MKENVAKHFILQCQFLWSFYMLWGGYMNIFRIFEIVLVPQLNP